MEELDWLVVMGGPMSVDESQKYFWLTAEKHFIENAFQHGKTVIGICLGAQLIADVLGAPVSRNRFPEIGWFPVQLTPAAQAVPLCQSVPEQFTAFHWHGDTFDLPHGAIHLARSEACDNQGFLYGERVLGLQFHLESTPASVRALVENCGDDIREGRYIQTVETMQRCPSFAESNALMARMLDRLAAI